MIDENMDKDISINITINKNKKNTNKKPPGTIFIPDGTSLLPALERTTHLGIGAHPDDLEIMAYHGIQEGLGSDKKWFTGVLLTHGGGSIRQGEFSDCSAREMQAIRVAEQKKAAVTGEYSAVVFLSHDSSVVKDPAKAEPGLEIMDIISMTRPTVIYTHSLADKHETHVAVALRVIDALRALPARARPDKLYGCEVWGSLDWITGAGRELLDASAYPHIARALIEVHTSQLTGGKRYDLAAPGRRQANAVFSDTHDTASYSAGICAMDMTPLLSDHDLDAEDYVISLIDSFRDEVTARIAAMKQKP